MVTLIRALWCGVLACMLGGCGPVSTTAEGIDAATEMVQQNVLPAVNSTTIVATSAAEAVIPAGPPPPATPTEAQIAAVDLVIRWEIGSPAQYRQRYSHPICPGGASGPTIGIGSDLGTQTPREIQAAWGWHPSIAQLVTASGQTGSQRCRAWVSQHRDIRVTYSDAERVFLEHEWPSYTMAARRAYKNGWQGISEYHRGGLSSVGYNRGFSFSGDRRRELRTIRDTCVPAFNAHCSARENVASCRVWAGTEIYRGICNRRKDEARLMVQ